MNKEKLLMQADKNQTFYHTFLESYIYYDNILT